MMRISRVWYMMYVKRRGGKIGEDRSNARHVNGIMEPELPEKKCESASRFSAHLHQYILITSYSGCSPSDPFFGWGRYNTEFCQSIASNKCAGHSHTSSHSDTCC